MLALPFGCNDPGSREADRASDDSPMPAAAPSFHVDDVRIVRVPDDVAVHWALTFDAAWVGETEPEPVRCRWRIQNREGEVVQVGVVSIAEERVDDRVAGTVYPDEVPGVPEAGEVRC